MSTANPRLFFGVPLEDAPRAALLRAVDELRGRWTERSRPRWTQPAGWHCTFKFLGSAPDPEARITWTTSLQQRAAKLALPAVLPVPWGPLGAFPSPAKARVLIAHLRDDAGQLAELARVFEELALEHGVPQEGRPYRPHVTIARLQRPVDVRPLLDGLELAGVASFGAITLFASEQGPQGSRYTPIWQAR